MPNTFPCDLSTFTSYQFFIGSSNINILVLYLVMFLTFMLRLMLYSLPRISLHCSSVWLLLFFLNLKCQPFQGIFLDSKLSSTPYGMPSLWSYKETYDTYGIITLYNNYQVVSYTERCSRGMEYVSYVSVPSISMFCI